MDTLFTSTHFTITAGGECGCRINYADGLWSACTAIGHKWTMGRVVRDIVDAMFKGWDLMISDNGPDANKLGEYDYTSLWTWQGQSVYFTPDQLTQLGQAIEKAYADLLGSEADAQTTPMPKFNVKLMGPCQVGAATHESFSIHDVEGNHVASGVNVMTDAGQRFIRIFDYDVPLKADLDTYFSSRTGVNEVSFSRPYRG